MLVSGDAVLLLLRDLAPGTERDAQALWLSATQVPSDGRRRARIRVRRR